MVPGELSGDPRLVDLGRPDRDAELESRVAELLHEGVGEAVHLGGDLRQDRGSPM